MKFIYIFDQKYAKQMIRHGFTLIREDKSQNIWIFENNPNKVFNRFDRVPHVFSDTLSF